MSNISFSRRLMDALLHQPQGSDPDIRALSLATLNDDDMVSRAALFWTQIGWFSALVATGWLWLIAFIAADLILYRLRSRLRQKSRSPSRKAGSDHQLLSVWFNIFYFAMISANIFVLTQAPSEQASVLAIIMAIGFSGYVAALFTAFPILAILNILLLNGALGCGLASGFSDVTRPFSVLSIGAIIGFWSLSRRTHETLLSAIRGQQVSRMLSLHDPLTKLPNRAFMREKLAQLLAMIGTRDGPKEIAVLCLDLDGFKQINDRHGHAAGDWVLVHVADVLRKQLSTNDFASRIGGDEYVVLLVGSEERAKFIGSAIIAGIGEPFDIGRAISARVGTSIGVSIATDQTRGLDALLEEADTALYCAKRGGKGQLQFSHSAPPSLPVEPMLISQNVLLVS